MREHEFWRLIGWARKRRYRPVGEGRTATTRTTAALLAALEDSSLTEVVGFHRRLGEVHARAHRWDVRTAFDIALGTLRTREPPNGIPWLILQGKRTYRRVLADPDMLAECDIGLAGFADVCAASMLTWLPRQVLNPEEDRELEAALDACLGEIDDDEPPPGTPPALDEPALRRRYPRLTERYFSGDATAPPRRVVTGNGGIPR